MKIKKTVFLLIFLGFFASETKSVVREVVGFLFLTSLGAYVYHIYGPQENTTKVEKKDDIILEQESNQETLTETDNTIEPVKTTEVIKINNLSQENTNKSEEIINVVKENSLNTDENQEKSNSVTQEIEKQSILSPRFKTIFASISGIVAIAVLGKVAFNCYKQYQEKRKTEQEQANQEYNEIEQLLS